MSTMLWAAAGGEIEALGSMLSFDAATHDKAREWFDRLPPESRQSYGTPENLIASVTSHRIAPIAAQVFWDHQADDDNAIIGLLLATEHSPLHGGRDADVRGSRSGQGTDRMTILALRRDEDGWRVVVPAAAIDVMSKTASP